MERYGSTYHNRNVAGNEPYVWNTGEADVVACIGPSISLEAFEVGDEVYTCFEQQGFDMQRIASRQEKWHIDLWEANRMQLLDFGVLPSNIELSGICTWKENADFSRHAGKV